MTYVLHIRKNEVQIKITCKNVAVPHELYIPLSFRLEVNFSFYRVT